MNKTFWLAQGLMLLALLGPGSTTWSDEPAKTDAETKKAETKKPSKGTVAAITVKGALPETAGGGGLFSELGMHLPDLLARLQRAGQDSSVQGVILRIRGVELGQGKLQEVRHAIGQLRKSGKRVIAELESGSTAEYLVASACDEIVMPESGEIMIPGVRAELMFYRGLFDLLGIQADMMQVGAFKGAAEPYTRREMSPEFRQQYESLLQDMFDQVVELIAADRRLDPGKVRELIDTGVFSAQAAKDAGLVDVVAYADELSPRLQKHFAVDKLEVVENYGKKKVNTDFSGMTGMFELFNLILGVEPQQRSSSAKKVAIIFASGAITSGDGGTSLMGGESVGSDTLVKAIRQADGDKSVVAIVLRVDSPGGSALASDQIWRAVQKCEKPVVASMGDVAASGGYYISMGCDKIFAEPGTITGSIGVVGGKIVLGGLYDKVGLSTDTISRGKNSGLLSEMSMFSDSERAVWKKMMEEIYRQFLAKAAAGRKMDVAKIEPLAGGRVWTGRQAKANGLIDELGTLHDAIQAAKQLAGIKPEEKLEQLILPKPRNFLDQLLENDLAAQATAARTTPRSELLQRLGELEQWQSLFHERFLYLLPYRVRIE